MGMNQNIILYHDTDPNQTMALRACIVSGMQTRSGASGEIVCWGLLLVKCLLSQFVFDAFVDKVCYDFHLKFA